MKTPKFDGVVRFLNVPAAKPYSTPLSRAGRCARAQLGEGASGEVEVLGAERDVPREKRSLGRAGKCGPDMLLLPGSVPCGSLAARDDRGRKLHLGISSSQLDRLDDQTVAVERVHGARWLPSPFRLLEGLDQVAHVEKAQCVALPPNLRVAHAF